MKTMNISFLSLIILIMGTCTMGECSTGRNDDAGRGLQNPAKEVVISVDQTQDNYHLSKEILVSVSIKNVSKEPIFIDASDHRKVYRLSLSDSDGTPVRRRETPEPKVDSSKKRPPVSHREAGIWPGKSIQQSLDLQKWFNIEKEGTYYLTVSRRLSWKEDSDFAVSEKAKIKVVK